MKIYTHHLIDSQSAWAKSQKISGGGWTMPNGLASCFTDLADLSFAADSEKILVIGWS